MNFIFTHLDYSKLYQLESRSLRTSFGKMIPSKNQSNPQYSFGKEVRIPRAKKPKTDYLYNPEPTNGFKFDKVNSYNILFSFFFISISFRVLSGGSLNLPGNNFMTKKYTNITKILITKP